ncbi:MAG: AMP-binding protein [Acidobacteriota bacterium]|nr:AMP-binding protein [Acidobacteriota bacterium]
MIAGDILGARARIDPRKTVLVYVPTGERFSYSELDRRARRMAQLWQQQLGLRKGDRIGILAQNSVEYVCAFFAAGKSGVILVPLNARQTAHELSYVAEDAGLSALLYETQFAAVARALQAARPAMKLLALDGAEWETAWKQADEADFHPTPCAPEDVYCLLYTSGTTGRPKGVMIPHRMIVWNAYNTAVGWQVRDNDVMPVFTPMYHAGGLTVFLTAGILLGCTMIVHRHFDASEVWRTIEQERVSLLFAVPTIFKVMMEVPEFATCDTRSVRWFISGGAPLPLYLIAAYLGRGILFKQGYGLTEVGVNCFAIGDEDARSKLGSIGKPMPFTEAQLVDEAGREAATGEVGELWLKGPHVCRGYWNNAQATAEVLDAGGWFHTGDMVRRDGEGNFYIAGRVKEMFISGGVNVCPAEVEAELLLHPAVEDAAVVGVEHAKWGEVGAAFVVLRAGHVGRAEELTEFLAHKLAHYKLPHHYRFVSGLPRTAYGKVLRAELQRQFRADEK